MKAYGPSEKNHRFNFCFSGRTIPTHQRNIHKDIYCNEIDIADVPTLMGTPGKILRTLKNKIESF